MFFCCVLGQVLREGPPGVGHICMCLVEEQVGGSHSDETGTAGADRAWGGGAGRGCRRRTRLQERGKIPFGEIKPTPTPILVPGSHPRSSPRVPGQRVTPFVLHVWAYAPALLALGPLVVHPTPLSTGVRETDRVQPPLCPFSLPGSSRELGLSSLSS